MRLPGLFTSRIVKASLLAMLVSALSVCMPSSAGAQPATDTVMMAALQRFKADTIYHVRVDTRDSTMHIFLGHVPLLKCRFTLLDEGDAQSYRDAWREKRVTGWQSVTKRKVWSGRPAVSDTVVRVVSEVSKVDPELISRVMPRRFVVDLTENFIIRVMTVEGAGEERSFEEKMGQFKQDWIPFMKQPHLDLVVTEKDAQTLYYALEPGTPIVLIEK